MSLTLRFALEQAWADAAALPELLTTARSLAVTVEAETPPLPYHNIAHVADAVRAMGRLCREARRTDRLGARTAALGLTAMVSHDLGHDGDARQPGRLEAQAAHRTDNLVRDLPEHDRAVIREVIVATAPARVASNAQRAGGALPPSVHGPEVDLLCVLGNEADVMMSLLPETGVQQARLLAAEMRMVGDPQADTVATFAGRLTFLRLYGCLSEASRALGVEDSRVRQIAVLEREGARLDSFPLAVADASFLASVACCPLVQAGA